MGLIAARFKSGADRASALWVSRKNKNSGSGHQPGDCDDEIGARSPQDPLWECKGPVQEPWALVMVQLLTS